jgi:hypothetical protein
MHFSPELFLPLRQESFHSDLSSLFGQKVEMLYVKLAVHIVTTGL